MDSRIVAVLAMAIVATDSVWAGEPGVFDAIAASVPQQQNAVAVREPLFSDHAFYSTEQELLEATKRGEFSKLHELHYGNQAAKDFLQTVVNILEKKSGTTILTLEEANKANDAIARDCWREVHGMGGGTMYGGSTLLAAFAGVTEYQISRVNPLPPTYLTDPKVDNLEYAKANLDRLISLCPASSLGVAKPYPWVPELEALLKAYSDATSTFVEQQARDKALAYQESQERQRKIEEQRQAALRKQEEQEKARRLEEARERDAQEREKEERKNRIRQDRISG